MSYRYLVRRLLGFIFSLSAIVFMVFVALRILPGDPAVAVLGDLASAEELQALRMQMGLQDPLLIQLKDYFFDILAGDWGQSYSRGQEVLPLVWKYFLSSLLLSVSALIVATVFAWILVFAFLKAKGQDAFFFSITAFFSSVPLYVWAPIGILVFSIHLRWLPVSGDDTLRHFILPSFTLGLVLFSPLARLMRATLWVELKKDYIRTAMAKGVSDTKTVWVHAFKNTWVPVMMMWLSLWGSILAGAVVTETLFDWPGLGKLFYSAFLSRDYPVIQGIVVFVAFMYSALQLVMDLLATQIDRRIEIDT